MIAASHPGIRTFPPLLREGMQSPSIASDPSASPLGGITPLTLSPPVANNDSYTLLHDSTLSVPASGGVLANDSDPNQLPLSAVLVSSTTHGNLTLNSDGSFVYTANAGYTGSDTFTYYATDGQANSNTATVTLTINDPNAPVSTADSYSGLHDQVLSADVSTGVLANDSDTDGDTLTASLVSGPTHGTLQFNGDGSFAYTPNAGYVGADSFQYQASDGVLTGAATTVNLTLTDTAPVALAHSYGTPENTTENVTVASGLLSGASDADGDPLAAILVSNASHGNVTVNSDGSFTYAPTAGYTGSDSFQYKASDGAESSTATVTLTVHGTDTTPTANAASYTVLHDQTLSETAAQGVLSHASDTDNDPLTASLVSGSGPTHGTLTLNSDGSFTYTPTAGYTGSDSFQYQVSDGLQTSSAATVTLTINDPNAPVAVADSYNVERNNEFDADAITGVLANDTDADGDTLTAAVASQPLHGTLTLNSDGSFAYTPNSNYTGSDSFTYTASDGVQSSAPATVSLTIGSSAPVANDDSYAVAENGHLFLDGPAVVANDYSPDNMPLTVTELTQPSHGTAVLTNSGTINYTPNAGYVGPDSFTYDDSDGTLTSNTATINLNVKASNTAPTATNLSYTLGHDTSLSTDSSSGVLSGASDADGDPLYALLANAPTHGTLQLTPYGDGSFTYTPNAGYSGTDSFSYTVSDGISTSTPATVTLTITNDTPTANPDSYSVLASGSTSVTAANGVLANDTDGEGDTLTAMLVSQPAHGGVMLNSDGSFTFTPNGFTGSDSFTYKASDGPNSSAPVTVTLTSGPVAQPQAYGVTHDQTLSVDGTDGLLTGAVDADGDTLTASLASGASHGTVTVNSDGSFTYTPATHYTGSDSFTYTVSDGTNTSAPATVTIDVTDDVPQAYPQSWDTPEGTPLSVNGANGVLASSSDDDGDALTAQLVSGTSNGTLQLGSDGSFTYTPNSGFFGTDSFTYDVTDGVSTSAAATVTITVDELIPDNLSGSIPSAVTTADFNNDGNPDVAMADEGLNTVSVYLDDSSGVVATTPVSTTTVGTAPVALAAADFGNGQQDLAVANSGSNTVSILLGNGSGGFTTGTALTGFNDPVGLAVGDFNGDGKTDLAVVNEGSNSISILLGNGNGTFTAGTSLTTGSSPTSIAAADFNGDSKLDLVVTNSASNSLSVFLGNGNGTFASALTDAVGTAPMSVATGDFNGDNFQDLAVANSGSNNVSVLLGNGDGTFQSAANYGVGSDPVSIASGNFDDDGSLDVAVVNNGSNTVSDLANIGNGTFLPPLNSAANSHPDAIAVGDLNGDGVMDEVVSLADPGIETIINHPDNLDARFQADEVAISGDGSRVAGYSWLRINKSQDYAIKVWDAKTGKPIAYLDGDVMRNPSAIESFAFSPVNPNLLAVGLRGTVIIWDLATNKAVASLPFFFKLGTNVPVTALAWSQDGSVLVAGAAQAVGKDVGQIWDMNKEGQPTGGSTLLTMGTGWKGFDGIGRLAVSKGTINDLATTIYGVPDKGQQIGVWVYNSENGKTEVSQLAQSAPAWGNISALTVSGPSVAVGLLNGFVHWYTRNKLGVLESFSTLDVKGNQYNAIARPPFADRWLLANSDGVTVFNGFADKVDFPLPPNPNLGFPAGTKLTNMALSLDGKTLAISGNDGTVHVYDVGDPKLAVWKATGIPAKKDNAGQPIILK